LQYGCPIIPMRSVENYPLLYLKYFLGGGLVMVSKTLSIWLSLRSVNLSLVFCSPLSFCRGVWLCTWTTLGVMTMNPSTYCGPQHLPSPNQLSWFSV
jgi:hypothetical protein